MLVKGLRINKICYFISKDFTKMRFDAFSIPHAYKRIKTTKKKTETRGSANIDSVPRIESNMSGISGHVCSTCYYTRNRTSSDSWLTQLSSALLPLSKVHS